jgi:A/G-specific adenine glycosylase
MKNFSTTLLKWYTHHKRELPWRGEKDPYKIWISEIILQQTRIAQGWNYYLRFIERFPTVTDLANTTEDEVLKYWQGLGYYSRARNLYTGAKYIVSKHNSKFPYQYENILKIKGVGEYTAAAIVSMAFNLPYPAVDGNVFRVLTRIFEIYTPIDTHAGKKEIISLANKLLDKKQAGIFNQAIMDFGALQCTPANPNCELCCFDVLCKAKQKNLQSVLPIKSQKTKIRTRYFYYLHIRNYGKTIIQKRNEKDIWKGLYEFPLIESEKEMSTDEVLSDSLSKNLLKNSAWAIASVSLPYRHQLSHQLIIARFISIVITKGNPVINAPLFLISESELEKYPVSRLMERGVGEGS